MSEKYEAFENSLAELGARERECARAHNALSDAEHEAKERIGALKSERDEALVALNEARVQTYRRAAEAGVLSEQLVDMLCPRHSYRDCSDDDLENTYNGDKMCPRCVLLKLVRVPDFGIDTGLCITMTVNRTDR